MVGCTARVGYNKPFQSCVEGVTCVEVFRSIVTTSHNNPITLKAHCRVRPLFFHGLQMCPLLRGHVETLKGVYCSPLAVAPNDVDNI